MPCFDEVCLAHPAPCRTLILERYGRSAAEAYLLGYPSRVRRAGAARSNAVPKSPARRHGRPAAGGSDQETREPAEHRLEGRRGCGRECAPCAEHADGPRSGWSRDHADRLQRLCPPRARRPARSRPAQRPPRSSTRCRRRGDRRARQTRPRQRCRLAGMHGVEAAENVEERNEGEQEDRHRYHGRFHRSLSAVVRARATRRENTFIHADRFSDSRDSSLTRVKWPST